MAGINADYTAAQKKGNWFSNLNNKYSSWAGGESFLGGGITNGALVNAGMGALNMGVNMLAGQNQSGVGNALQTIGGLASNIPGVGGLIGAGVGVVGGLVNAAFGSHINDEFVQQTQLGANQVGSQVFNANTNVDLLNDWQNMAQMSNVSKSEVGSDGWFSNKASRKTRELNRQIDEANQRQLANFGIAAENVDTQNDLRILQNMAAYGGPINSFRKYYGDGGEFDQPQTFFGRVAQAVGASPRNARGADVVSSVLQMTPYGHFIAALDLGRDVNRAYHKEKGAWEDIGWDLASMLPFLNKAGLKEGNSLIDTIRSNSKLRSAVNATAIGGRTGDFVSDTYGANKANIHDKGGYLAQAKALIRQNEGWRDKPYSDTPKGKNWRSVGYGFNDSGFRDKYPEGISKHYEHGITKKQAEEELDYFLNKAEKQLKSIYDKQWNDFTDSQKAAILDTYYQRPASVGKSSRFYKAVTAGEDAGRYLGVSGYNKRNKVRQDIFGGGYSGYGDWSDTESNPNSPSLQEVTPFTPVVHDLDLSGITPTEAKALELNLTSPTFDLSMFGKPMTTPTQQAVPTVGTVEDFLASYGDFEDNLFREGGNLFEGGGYKIPKKRTKIKTIRTNNGVLTGEVDDNGKVYWFKEGKYITPHQMKNYKYYDPDIKGYRKLGDKAKIKPFSETVEFVDIYNPVHTSTYDKLLNESNRKEYENHKREEQQNIPLQNQKWLTLRTKGKMNLADVPMNMLDSIAVNAGRSGTDFWTDAALIGKESTFGGFSKALNSPYSPTIESIGVHSLTNNHSWFNTPEGDYIHASNKRFPWHEERGRVEGEKDMKYALEHGLVKATTPHYSDYILADAFKRYQTAPTRYNPGQKNYVPMLNDIRQELLGEKQLQEYWNTRGKQEYERGQQEGMANGGKLNIKDMNIFDFGGGLTHGVTFDTGVDWVNEGKSHEQNPYGGVMVGSDEEGIPNLVEEDEAIWNGDYVFSRRMKVPKKLREKYHLKDDATFADAIKVLTKDSEERPLDNISRRTQDHILGEFADSQEELRAAKAQRAMEKEQQLQEDFLTGVQFGLGGALFANGGGIHIDPSKRGFLFDNSFAYGGPFGNVFAGEGNKANRLSPEESTRYLQALNAAQQRSIIASLFGDDSPITRTVERIGEVVEDPIGYFAGDQIDAIMNRVAQMSQPQMEKFFSTSLGQAVAKGVVEADKYLSSGTGDNMQKAGVNRWYKATGRMAKPIYQATVNAAKRAMAQSRVNARGQMRTPTPKGSRVVKETTTPAQIAKNEAAAIRAQRNSTPPVLRRTTELAPVNRGTTALSNINRGATGVATTGTGTTGMSPYISRPTGVGFPEQTMWNATVPFYGGLGIAAGNLMNWEGEPEVDAITGAAKVQRPADRQAGTANTSKKGTPVTPSREKGKATKQDIPSQLLEFEPFVDESLKAPEPKTETNPNALREAIAMDGYTPEYTANDAAIVNTLTPGTTEQSSSFTPKQTWTRYAPLVMSGLMGLKEMLTPADYGNADSIMEAAYQVGSPVSIGTEYLGDYRKRDPFDERYLMNLINQRGAATNRNMMNLSGGNRAAAMAGILSNDLTTQMSLAEAARQSYLANRADDAQVAEFNRGTNQFNATAQNQRNQFLAGLNSQRQQAMLSGISQGARLRQAIKDQRDAAIYGNLSNFAQGLGNIGWENSQYNMMGGLADEDVLKYIFDKDFITTFKNRLNKKNIGEG